MSNITPKFQVGDLVKFTHDNKDEADMLIRHIIENNKLGIILKVTTSVSYTEYLKEKTYSQYEVLFGNKRLPIEEDSLILVSKA